MVDRTHARCEAAGLLDHLALLPVKMSSYIKPFLRFVVVGAGAGHRVCSHGLEAARVLQRPIFVLLRLRSVVVIEHHAVCALTTHPCVPHAGYETLHLVIQSPAARSQGISSRIRQVQRPSADVEISRLFLTHELGFDRVSSPNHQHVFFRLRQIQITVIQRRVRGVSVLLQCLLRNNLFFPIDRVVGEPPHVLPLVDEKVVS